MDRKLRKAKGLDVEPLFKSKTQKLMDEAVARSIEAMNERLFADRQTLIRSGWPAEDLIVGTFPDGSKAIASAARNMALAPAHRIELGGEDGRFKISVR